MAHTPFSGGCAECTEYGRGRAWQLMPLGQAGPTFCPSLYALSLMAAYPFLRHVPEHVYPTMPLLPFLAYAPPILDIPTFCAWRSLN